MSGNDNSDPKSGSPPLTTNGNGGASNVTTVANGNGNGHGFPRSGSNSPRQMGVEERNLLMLQMLNVNLGSAEMAAKHAKGTLLAGESELEVVTNVYGLNHSKPLTVNSYHVNLARITPHGNFPLNTSKRRLPDYSTVIRRRFYQQVMPLFYQKYAYLFGDDEDNHLVDYASTLFSFRELAVEEDSKKPKILEIPAEAASAAGVTRDAGVSLSIQSANKDFMVQNFTGISRDLDSFDATLLQFTELATSHGVAQNFDANIMYDNHTCYFMNPADHGYSAYDSPDLGNGKFLAIGAAKTVILIEGVDGHSVFSDEKFSNGDSLGGVVIESKKTPFYLNGPLADTVCRILKISRNQRLNNTQIDTLQPFIRNLACHRTYGNTKSVALLMTRLSSKRANEEIIPEGEYTGATIAEYFQRKFQITLQCPEWPLVEMVRRGKSMFFPIELLDVADFQRVKFGNLTPDDIKLIIKVCAIDPLKKLEEIERSARAFNINGDKFCQNSGISVSEEPLKVTARVLSSPQVLYGNGGVNPKDGRWRLPPAARFTFCSTCQSWIAVLIDYPHPRPFDLGRFGDFCRKLMAECRLRGMTLADPQDVVRVRPNDNDIEKLFSDAYRAGVEFLFFGHPDAELELHPHIKTFERKYMITTQCVKTSTVDKVVDGQSKLTLENIVAKTNVKLGGINYSILLKDYSIDQKTLFIGLGVNHPGGGFTKMPEGQSNEGAVSILGYSANDSRQPGAFVGNFFVQPLYQDEQLTVLDELMEEILTRFVANRGYAPSRVVVYRSGCSQGQFNRVLKFELQVIVHFVKKFSPSAPVTLIVPSVMHNVRLFRKNINPTDRAPEQNIPAGTVVDTTIVHSKFMEFYLNSHVAIQGTAKTPKYTILFTSETNATLDLFQRWTNALCYQYQIVNSPVSVPAPVYIANCYADRGRQIANNFALTLVAHGHEEEGLIISAEQKPAEGKQEYVKKSFAYNFSHRPALRNRRINA